jgi:hypothetical protein
MDPLEIITNRKFIDIDTYESVDNYINEICADPDFLCKSDEHKRVCGTNTSIYTSVNNVNEICENIKEANVCENDIKECVVLANNTFEDSKQFVSTSFSNIIIPIPKAFDNDGNQKFIRLPALSSTKKKNSNEICSVCACMDRFAKSPGSGYNDTYTSPRQNTCVFGDEFEYYYYPYYVDQIRDKIKDTPIVKIGPNGKYHLLNKNIIHIRTEDDLNSVNLYNILVKNGISPNVTLEFMKGILYKNDKESLKELDLFLTTQKQTKSRFGKKSSFGQTQQTYKNNFFLHFVFVVFMVIILMQLLKNV